MTAMVPLTSAAGHDLARAARAGDRAVEGTFNALPLADQAVLVQLARGRDRAELLFLAEDIAPVLIALAPGAVRRVLTACDDLEQTLVVANLGPGQLQHQLDLAVWRDDALDPFGLDDWQEALATNDEADAVASQLSACDPDFLAWWLWRVAPPGIDGEVVTMARTAGEGWAATPGDLRPREPSARTLIDRLYGGSPKVFGAVVDRLLDLVDDANPTTPLADRLASTARQGVIARLAQAGFLGPSDGSLRRPVQLPPADPGPALGALPSRVGEPLVLRALHQLVELDPDTARRVSDGMVALYNRLALEVPAAADDEAFVGRCGQAEALINLALERLAGSVSGAMAWLAGSDVVDLYRTGWTRANKLTQVCEDALQRSAIPWRIVDQEPLLGLPPVLQRVVDRLRHDPPLVVEGGGTRPVAHRADIHELEHEFDELSAYLRAIGSDLPITLPVALLQPGRLPSDDALTTTDIVLAANIELAAIDRDPADGLATVAERRRAAALVATPDGLAAARDRVIASLHHSGWSERSAVHLLDRHLDRALAITRRDSRLPEGALTVQGLTALADA